MKKMIISMLLMFGFNVILFGCSDINKNDFKASVDIEETKEANLINENFVMNEFTQKLMLELDKIGTRELIESETVKYLSYKDIGINIYPPVSNDDINIIITNTGDNEPNIIVLDLVKDVVSMDEETYAKCKDSLNGNTITGDLKIRECMSITDGNRGIAITY